MNDLNKIRLNIINGQLIALFLFIVTLFISILLAYNEKLSLQNKTPLFENEDVLKIAIINKIIVVILGLYFVYTSIIEKEINNKNSIQIFTSILALLASLVGLIDLINNYINLQKNITSYNFTI